METIETLIIGGGLSGLSCAYHLQALGRKYLLAEKEAAYGGLCGSFKQNGFTFDWSGHLLHLHTPYGKKLVETLLGKNMVTRKRDTAIYSHGVYTGYPFQASLYGLPPEVVDECVEEFLKAAQKNRTAPADGPFGKWAQSVFGKGICRHFMHPYNRKLWQTPLNVLTADWCAPFVPRPNTQELLKGAYSPQTRDFGYNVYFSYPRRGGAQALCDALAKNLAGLRAGAQVTQINLRAKTAVIEGLGTVRFNHLINTMPLKDFIGIIADAPKTARTAAAKLKTSGINILNLGVSARRSKRHWVYFPEADIPFYRAGIASNFSPEVAPKGMASFYIELPQEGFDTASKPAIKRRVTAALKRCGFMDKTDSVTAAQWLKIPCAYVVYDNHRRRAVETLMRYLNKNSCRSIGRYGGWKYSFMEEALNEGKAAAEAVSADSRAD